MKRIEYESIQKHGNCYVWKALKDVDITCPECMVSKEKLKVHLSMGNTFTLVCRNCRCVFTIRIIEENTN